MPPSKEEKRLYDIEYRRRNKERLKAKKAAYYQTPEGKACTLRNREKMKAFHKEYVRREDQKLKTKRRDERRTHGEWLECVRMMQEIWRIARAAYPSQYERLKARGYDYNTKNKRRRLRKRLLQQLNQLTF